MFDKLMSQDFEIVLNADWADLVKRVKPNMEVGKFILSSKSEEGNVIWSNNNAKVKVVIDYDTINLQGKYYTHTIDVCEDIGSLPEMLFRGINFGIFEKLVPTSVSSKPILTGTISDFTCKENFDRRSGGTHGYDFSISIKKSNGIIKVTVEVDIDEFGNLSTSGIEYDDTKFSSIKPDLVSKILNICEYRCRCEILSWSSENLECYYNITNPTESDLKDYTLEVEGVEEEDYIPFRVTSSYFKWYRVFKGSDNIEWELLCIIDDNFKVTSNGMMLSNGTFIMGFPICVDYPDKYLSSELRSVMHSTSKIIARDINKAIITSTLTDELKEDRWLRVVNNRRSRGYRLVPADNTFNDKFETPLVDNSTKSIAPYTRDDAKDIAAAFRVYYGCDEEVIDDANEDAPLIGSIKSIDFEMADSDEFGIEWKADITIDSNYGDVRAELSGTISYYGDFDVHDTSYYTDEDVDSFLDDIVEDICKVKALSLLEWYSDQDLDLFLKDTNLDEDEYKDIFKQSPISGKVTKSSMYWLDIGEDEIKCTIRYLIRSDKGRCPIVNVCGVFNRSTCECDTLEIWSDAYSNISIDSKLKTTLKADFMSHAKELLNLINTSFIDKVNRVYPEKKWIELKSK